MKQYLDLLQDILDNGTEKDDRTGTGTKSVFGRQMRFDLSEGFPLLTTKKVHLKSIIYELLWLIKGETNIKYLVDNGVRIWNEWPYVAYTKSSEYKGEDIKEFALKVKENDSFAEKWGDLGPVYGKQWRDFNGFDQIKWVIEEIKKCKVDEGHSTGRRLIVNAWNAAEIDKMALPPCHMMFQFYVANGKLSCQLYQRSCDVFLGVPFNIASYSLLTMMMAQATGLEAGDFVWTGGDVHIYNNLFDQVKEQLTREPRSLPKMKINPSIKSLFDFDYDDFELIEYNPYPPIKGKVAV